MNYFNRSTEFGAWTVSEVDTLKKLWAEGLSQREISGALPGRSKSAVAGQIDRMGLTRKPKGERQPRAKRDWVPREQSPRQRFRIVRNDAPYIPKSKVWHPLDGTTPVTLLDRKRSECAWPLDIKTEPGLNLVCGQPIWGECCYCAAHKNVAYLPKKLKHVGWRA